MNVKNPQLKVRKPVFTLIRTEKCMYIYHPVNPLISNRRDSYLIPKCVMKQKKTLDGWKFDW